MNRYYLQDYVKGKYGRKIAYANVEVVTEDNVLDILANSIGIFNRNKTAIQYLLDYVKGDQPILYREKVTNKDINNKVMENRAYEIVQFNVSQTYGEPIQYVCTRDDERINKAVDKLNEYLKNAFKYQRNIVQGEYKSTVGTSYLAVQRTENKEKPFRIVVPSPMNTFIIYSSITEEPLLAVQELKDSDGQMFYMCYSETLEFVVKNSRLVEVTNSDGFLVRSKPHAYGGIPIIEVPNNKDRLSDVEIVISLLDSINIMQSNRLDGLEQFIQYWVKFINCEIDDEEWQRMKEEHALTVKSNNGDAKADVDIMTQELNQTENQVMKEDLWDSALSILAIPSKQGNTGGDTQGAVELRNGWDFSKNRAKLKDAYVIEAESRFADIVLNELRIAGKGLDITSLDFDINIPHSPQDNMTVKANVLALLLQSGIHPLIAIKVCGLWNDSEKVYLLSKPYLDVLYKTIDDEIENIPNASEQLQKAQEIASQYTKQQEEINNENR